MDALIAGMLSAVVAGGAVALRTSIGRSLCHNEEKCA